MRTSTPCSAEHGRLGRGGPAVLRLARRPYAVPELAGRRGGQLRPCTEETPHRVLPVLQRALLHVPVREARAGAGCVAHAVPRRGAAGAAADSRVEAF